MSDFIRQVRRAPQTLIAACAVLAGDSFGVLAQEKDASSVAELNGGAPPSESSLSAVTASAFVDIQPNANTYVIGDRLKIAFFEKVDAADGESDQSELIERVELSGEHVVQDDGSIFLPIFGAVTVVDRTPRQLEATLAALFKSRLGRNGKASVILAEREPVYIVGSITKPGTYKYTPGMTVMHAIALSEGLGATYADFFRAAESIRERERLDKSIHHLQLLLARKAALTAEREEKAAEVPDRLVLILGKDKANALVDSFVTERKLASTARNARKQALRATIKSAHQEIELLRARLTHLDANIKNRSERLATASALRKRGTFSDHALYQVRGDLSDVLEREDAVKTSLAQTEEKLAQAQHEIFKLDAETLMEMHRELNSIENDLAEETVVLSSSERLIRAAGNAAQALPLTPADLSFVIVRRTAKGPKRIIATAQSMLQAGDLLEINLKPKLAQR